MIYLGTSGFSYDDWVGPFYPLGIPKKDRLSYYAREFSACEINSTYYAIPNAFTFKAMARKVPDKFLFSVKANQQMTHEREGDLDVFKSFKDALSPLIEEGKLGCILAQFPYSFRFSADNRSYLERFREQLRDLPLVVEFRNAKWITEDVFGWMRSRNMGFCCVDEPKLPNLLPPVAEATGKIAYVRFHGRNKEKWWNHEKAYERYDYTYSKAELEEWLPKIKSLSDKAEIVFLFANNHWKGQAIDCIRQLRMILDKLVQEGSVHLLDKRFPLSTE